MACCHSCGEEIGYGSMYAGVMRKFRRNMWRRSLPVFECPHCGADNQESALTSVAFALVAVAICLLALLLVDPHGGAGRDPLVMVLLFALLLTSHYAWWRLVARLKEPCRFFWE
jgi:drug/metabolite transporter (DMT)-like permease